MKLTVLDIDKSKFFEYSLVLLYLISLFSSTCFFYNPKFIIIGHISIAIPIGLLFFPLTFGICNMLQDRFGKRGANSLVITAFLADTLLVAFSYLLAYLGDRQDYRSVFFGLPSIMMASWLFMIITSFFNVWLYEKLKKRLSGTVLALTIRFFYTITLTELLTSSLSMPLMLVKHGINWTVILTIIIIVAYKVIANIIISMLYFYYGLYRHKIRQTTIQTNISSS